MLGRRRAWRLYNGAYREICFEDILTAQYRIFEGSSGEKSFHQTTGS